MKNGAPGESRTPDLLVRRLNQPTFNPWSVLFFCDLQIGHSQKTTGFAPKVAPIIDVRKIEGQAFSARLGRVLLLACSRGKFFAPELSELMVYKSTLSVRQPAVSSNAHSGPDAPRRRNIHQAGSPTVQRRPQATIPERSAAGAIKIDPQ